jgi:hypothetical protein
LRRLAARGVGDPADDAQRLLLADALHTALGPRSRGLLFALLRRLTGRPADKLAGFRTAFCAEAPACGLTETAAELLWERMVQGMFSRVRAGATAVADLASRLAKPPKELSEDAALSFATDALGAVLTKQVRHCKHFFVPPMSPPHLHPHTVVNR